MRSTGKEGRRKVAAARLQGHWLRRGGVALGGTVLMCGLLLLSVVNGWSDEPAQMGGHHHHRLVSPSSEFMQQSGPVEPQFRLAMPKGWRFTIPTGDHHAGRQVFIDFECFKCHEVAGEDFPAPKAEQGDVGPALTGMGPMHPAEYFVETIIDPNASAMWRIKHHSEENKGYLGADGRSKMPSYSDTMTARQVIDLVAYLKSLTAGGEHIHQH